MQKVFEKIIEKLEEQKEYYKDIRKNTYCRVTETDNCDSCWADHYLDARLETTNSAIEIVKQTAAEYDNGWIPVSERLPDLGKRILLQDFGGNITLEKCELKKRVKGFTEGNLWASADNYIAWQPLPATYQQSEIIRKKTNFDRCCESMEAMAQIIDIAKVGWTKEQIIEWLKKEECEIPE